MNDDNVFDNLGEDPLGGNVPVPGFDPGMDDFSVDDTLEREAKIDSWAKNNGLSPSPLGSNWNTLPFGTPSGCKNNLFVHIKDSADIQPTLNNTIKHLSQCPETAYVVFHVGGSIGYLDWLRALDQFLLALRSGNVACKARFATRIAHSWTPRPTQRAQYWKGATHQGATQNGKPINFSSYQIKDASTWVKFKHRIWLLEELGLLDLDCGYIKEHTDQPPPQTSGPDLSFGAIKGGLKIDNKSVRIYFRHHPVQHLTLGFPHDFFKLGLANIAKGKKNVWSVHDPAFLKYPYRWLKVNLLPNRRP
jgi:hypothetical protein